MEYTGAQLQYLDHLGIDVWVPRDQVLQASVIPSQVEAQPNQQQSPLNDTSFSAAIVEQPINNVVAPSQPQAYPENAQPTPTLTAIPSANVQAPAAINPVQNTIAAEASTTAPQQKMQEALNVPAYPGGKLSAAIDKTNSSNIEAPAVVKAPHFNIQFWCYSTGLWIVSGNVNLQPEEHKLVHNIAHFVQGKKRKPKHVGIFSWPMLDSPNIDQGPDVAIKHLKDHIHRLQEVSAVTKIIAFSDCEAWFDHLSPVKVSFALNQVIGSPENKKSLWQQLIPHQLSD